MHVCNIRKGAMKLHAKTKIYVTNHISIRRLISIFFLFVSCGKQSNDFPNIPSHSMFESNENCKYIFLCEMLEFLFCIRIPSSTLMVYTVQFTDTNFVLLFLFFCFFSLNNFLFIDHGNQCYKNVTLYVYLDVIFWRIAFYSNCFSNHKCN